MILRMSSVKANIRRGRLFLNESVRKIWRIMIGNGSTRSCFYPASFMVEPVYDFVVQGTMDLFSHERGKLERVERIS